MIKWTIDPAHSEIGFRVKHLKITNLKGYFQQFNGEAITSEDGAPQEVTFTADTASIDTANEQRDQHLKGSDFFDAEKHPKLSFKSTSVVSKGTDEYEVKGDLVMRGVSKLVTLQVEFNGIMKDPWGNEKAGFSLTGKINRKDWELNWNAPLEAGGFLVSDEVTLLCDVQLSKQS